MKAAVCRAHGAPLTIEDIDIAAPAADQVEVTMKAVAICHSDIHFAEGAWGGDLPAVYGHEAAGIVTQVGAGVTDLSVGDHVCVTLIRSCGNCPPCHKGSNSECDQPWDKSLDASPLSEASGAKVVRAMNCGAFAEKVVVSPSQCAIIPKSMDWAAASLVSCGVITGVGAAINTAQVKPGDTVAVIGAGGVGLNAIQGAAIAGAARIIAIDVLDDKLEAARSFGATHTVNAKTDDLAADVMAQNDGRGVDYVLVTVGAPVAYASAPALLCKGGAMVIVGMPPVGTLLDYDPLNMADGSYRYLGSSMGQTTVRRDIPWLIGLYEQGRLKLDELVTGTYTLDQINEAFADTKAGHALRNVILFD